MATSTTAAAGDVSRSKKPRANTGRFGQPNGGFLSVRSSGPNSRTLRSAAIAALDLTVSPSRSEFDASESRTSAGTVSAYLAVWVRGSSGRIRFWPTLSAAARHMGVAYWLAGAGTFRHRRRCRGLGREPCLGWGRSGRLGARTHAACPVLPSAALAGGTVLGPDGAGSRPVRVPSTRELDTEASDRPRIRESVRRLSRTQQIPDQRTALTWGFVVAGGRT